MQEVAITELILASLLTYLAYERAATFGYDQCTTAASTYI